MAIYSLPFAASFATYTTLSDLVVNDEIISVYCLNSMLQSLKTAIFAFCCTVALLYAWLLFFLAPSAYQYSKTVLVSAVEERVRELPVGVVQQIGPTAAMYCSAKQLGNTVEFSQLFFACKQRDNELLCCASHNARLNAASVVCEDGHIVIVNQENPMVVNFSKATLSLSSLIPQAAFGSKHTTPRVATGWDLIGQWHNADMWRELYKRIAQLWWLVVITLLSMMLALFDTSKKNRFIRGIVLSGILFMLSHSLIAIGYSCSNTLLLSSALIYGSGIALLILLSVATKQ